MTAPRFADCKCGHSKGLHPERTEEACIQDGCGCAEYRPGTMRDLSVPNVRPAITPPSPPAPPSGPSAEQILAAGRRSPRTKKLADKIAGDLERLRERLVEERVAAQARQERDNAKAADRAEVERLTAALAAAKAKLGGARTPPSRVSTRGSHSCPDCERTFDTAQGRGSHRARAHGFRKAG